jgi:hypothetical protein
MKRAHFSKPQPTTEKRVPEWRLQAEIISEFHRLESKGWPFTCEGDQNAEQRGVAARTKAKVTGMTAGSPDIRVFLPGGRLGLIELKAKGGRLSADQIIRHARLRELGFELVVLKVASCEEAKEQAVAILRGWLARTGSPTAH